MITGVCMEVDGGRCIQGGSSRTEGRYRRARYCTAGAAGAVPEGRRWIAVFDAA